MSDSTVHAARSSVVCECSAVDIAADARAVVCLQLHFHAIVHVKPGRMMIQLTGDEEKNKERIQYATGIAAAVEWRGGHS